MIRAIVLACVFAGPSVAQTGNAQLDLYTNGQTPDGLISFTFGIEDCVGSAVTNQTYPSGSSRTLAATFPLDVIRTTSEEMLDFDDLDLAQINFLLKDGVDTIDTHVTLRSDEADVRAGWADQGAVCEDTNCTSVVQLDRIAIPVAGPSAAGRAEFVLRDIRAMAAACATNEQGS